MLRGEDLVSLGWCFWHRACFACLLCKAPLSLDIWQLLAKESDEWMEREAAHKVTQETIPVNEGKASTNHWQSKLKDGGVPVERRTVRPGAIELEKVPLCADCERKELPHRSQRQLMGQVTKSLDDGGLSISREAMLNDKGSEIEPLRLKKKDKIETDKVFPLVVRCGCRSSN